MATTIIPARAIIPFLVAMMLFTGVCNTLLTKYQVCLVSSPPLPASSHDALSA
jgi:hypothetical protein